MGSEFSNDQKRYLEGFATGVTAARAARGSLPADGAAQLSGPDAVHIKAQDRVVTSGKKLTDQEKWKREQHPFDGYARLKQQAKDNAAPKPPDNFRWRYYGLFYVAPTQSARRAGRVSDRTNHLAADAAGQRIAGAGARHAVPANQLHHRRRQAEEGARARQR
jgi:hypothetical protein